MVEKLDGLHNVDVSQTPKNGLAFIDIYFGGACNLNCIYCFTNHGKGRLTTEDRKHLLDDARMLGAQTLVSTGAGEPLQDRGFKEVIGHAYSLGMKSVIYTNAQPKGMPIDVETAEFLFTHGVRPLVKIESLDEKVHDAITRRKGSLKVTLKSVENLLSVGYGGVEKDIAEIGVASVYTALNINSLPELKKYCDERGILLVIDELGLEKRAYENKDSLFVPKPEIDRIKRELQVGESGIPGESCLQSLSPATCFYSEFGIRIDQDGNVSYCTMQDTDDIIGNVLEIGLKKAVEYVKVANRVARREKIKTLRQINDALKQGNVSCQIKIPGNTCLFKAGDNFEVEKGKLH